jgi:hypothetical protein
MQPETGRGLGEQLLRKTLLHRRRRIVALAHTLERIAAGLDIALDVAGHTRNAGDIFELVAIRLELIVADRPVLDVIAFGQNALAVALDHVATDAEIVGQKAPGLPVPVQAGAADTVAGKKAAPLADRQRGLRRVVAHGQRFLFRAQEHVVANRIAQLVRRRADIEIGGRVAPRAALDRDHFEAGARKLVSQDRSGPAETDDDEILARETAGHQCPPQAGRPCRPTGGSA